MLVSPGMNEMMGREILQDRLREAEQHRLLRRAEAARRPEPKVGLLVAIRQALAARRTFVRPTPAAS